MESSKLLASAVWSGMPLVGNPLVRASVFAGFQAAEQGLVGKFRIGPRHRVPLQQESARTAAGEKAVKEKPASAQRQDNIPRPRVCNRTTGDLNYVARPENRQHAFAANL
jgi:hypothetical protein